MSSPAEPSALASSPPSSRHDGVTDRAEAACTAMIDAWARGHRVAAEAVFAGWSGTPDPEEAFEVVYLEYLLGERHGGPDLESLCNRFPALAERLRRQVTIHQSVRSPWGEPLGSRTESTMSSPAPLLEAEPAWPNPAGYRVDRMLGRGGMGVVYQAHQLQLDRPVALKMVRAGRHATSGELARFRAEAQAIARLQHPNIVQIYSVGDLDGTPFIEMEYVNGGNLADLIRGRPQGLHITAALLATIAGAIHAVHQQGVIHRDLKPSNVLLTGDGLPKIADFGLAKLVDATETLTLNDSFLGSPQYMAPEQAGEVTSEVGPTTDVYTLGVILYEMLTGRTPFAAATPLALLALVRSAEPVAPSRLRPGLPRDLETICLRCLAKEPSRRYPTAAALADDLNRWSLGRPIEARPLSALGRTIRWSRRNPVTAALAAILLLSLGTGAIGMAVLWAQARAEAVTSREFAQREQKTRNEVERLSAGLSLDQGLSLAETGDVASGLRQMVRSLQLDAGDPALVQATRVNITRWLGQVPRFSARSPLRGVSNLTAISPDGRFGLVSPDQRSVQFLDLATRRPTGIPIRRHESAITKTCFRRDGKVMASADRSGLVQFWDVATSQPTGAPLQHPGAVWLMAIHPAGDLLVTGSADGLRYWQISTRRHVDSRLVDEPVEVLGFSHDGATLVTGKGKAVQRRDGLTGQPIGPPIPIGNFVGSIAFHPRDDRFAVGFGPPDAFAFQYGPVGVQLFETRTGQPSGPLMPHGRDVSQIAFRPDGQFLVTSESEGTTRIWGLQGTLVSPPITAGGEVASLICSPDGRSVLIGITIGMVRSGDLLAKTTANAESRAEPNLDLSILPDGQRVELAGDQTVRVLDLTSILAPMRLVADRATLVRLSPDGRTLLTAGIDIAARLWDCQNGQPLGAPLPHHALISAAEFSPDGRQIATGGRDATVRLWSSSGELLHPPIPVQHWVSDLRFSPDGSRLLATCEGSAAHLIDPATGQTVGPVQHYRDIQAAVARVLLPRFQPDGRVALTACNDNIIGRLDSATGQPISSWSLPTEIKGIRYRPDGQALVILAGLKLWVCDARTGRTRLAPFGQGIYSFDISPDGRWVATGTLDKKLQLWDLASGRPIGGPIGQFPEAIHHVQIHPDGKTLATVTQSGVTRLWDLASRRPLGPAWHHEATSGTPGPVLDPAGRFLAVIDHGVRLCSTPQPPGEPLAQTMARIEGQLGSATTDAILPSRANGSVEPPVRDAASPAALGDWHKRVAFHSLLAGDRAAASWDLRRAIAVDSTDWYARRLLGAIRDQMGQSADSSAEAIPLPPEPGSTARATANWHAFLGFEALRQQRWEAAEAEFTEALAGEGPGGSLLHDARGLARIQLTNWPGAAADLHQGPWQVQRMGDDIETLAIVTALADDRPRFAAMRRVWRDRLRAPTTQIRSPRGFVFLTLINSLLPGDNHAEEWLDWIKLAVLQLEGKDLHEGRFVLALCLIRVGDPGAALKELTALASDSPGIYTAEVPLLLVQAQRALGHEEEARRLLAQMKPLPPTNNLFTDGLRQVLLRQAEASPPLANSEHP